MISYKDINWLKIARILLVVASFLLLLNLSGKLISYFSTGADSSEIYNKTVDYIKSKAIYVYWLEQRQIIGEELNDFQKEDIGRAYGEAWRTWNKCLLYRNDVGLDDYFSDSIRLKLIGSIDTSEISVERVDMSHHIDPYLFSLDKHVLAFTDRDVEIIKDCYYKGDFVGTIRDTNDYEVIMTLDDSRWKIRHIRRIDTERIDSYVQRNSGNISIKGKKFYKGDKSIQVKGINYYPQSTPWSDFWPNYNVDSTKRDMRLMSDLGFNAVRFFIPYEEFVGITYRTELVGKIKSFIEIAASEDLMVMPTLFDFPQTYRLEAFAIHNDYLQTILTACKNYDNILAWDLKNEPDLDFDLYEESTIDRWFDFVLEKCKRYDPNHLFTVGWSKAEPAMKYSDKFDFVSFHYYEDSEQIENTIEKLQEQANGAPIVCSEFGLSTFKKWWFPIGSNEQDQSEHLEHMTASFKQEDIGYFFWTFYDFKAVPDGIFGIKPWINGIQKNHGLITTNGQKKSATQVLVE